MSANHKAEIILLTTEERAELLTLARQSIEAAVKQSALPRIILAAATPTLQKPGASFVTLTIRGNLRGCIGALQAYQPLIQDVQEHAVAAALDDPRFPPVSSVEVPRLHIEISRLTEALPFEYSDPDDLLTRLRPSIDGVILRDGIRRATFLPQVWAQLPDPAQFLSQLCLKMGASATLWRSKKLDVSTYQVEEFQE